MDFPEQIRHNKQIGQYAKLVWYEVRVMAGKSTFCITSYQQLCDILGASKDTIKAAVKQLEMVEFIRVEDRGAYKLVYPKKFKKQ